MIQSSCALFRSFARRTARPQDAPPARPRILIVDDESGIRAFLMRVLAPIDCEVVAAASGPEALQMFERSAPIDLLVSDLMMPVMNGLELGRRLQQLTPALPVLYLTGYSDALFDERPILGANEAYVAKPISATGLYEAISMALYGRLGRPAAARRCGDAHGRRRGAAHCLGVMQPAARSRKGYPWMIYS